MQPDGSEAVGSEAGGPRREPEREEREHAAMSCPTKAVAFSCSTTAVTNTSAPHRPRPAWRSAYPQVGPEICWSKERRVKQPLQQHGQGSEAVGAMVVGSSLRHCGSSTESSTPSSGGSLFRLRQFLHACRHLPLLRRQQIAVTSVSIGTPPYISLSLLRRSSVVLPKLSGFCFMPNCDPCA